MGPLPVGRSWVAGVTISCSPSLRAGELSWASFCKMVDEIFVPDGRLADDVSHTRSEVASLGDCLGHWDVVSDERGTRICIAPPVLAALPRPGLPGALLCGSRSSDTYQALASACRAAGVTISVTKQDHLNPYAASRVEVVGDSHDRIAAAAATLGIGYQQVPAAWALAEASGSLDRYLTNLRWGSDAELNWIRKDFDPTNLRFARVPSGSDHPPFGLSNYTLPAGWARQDRLWRGQENARVDRSWGRYAVLQELGMLVLRFDPLSGSLAVPKQVPLPKIPARSLALCSGRPPAFESGEGLGCRVYPDVPVSIFEALAGKLGQHERYVEGAEPA